jgi:hypothetical protein
VAVVDPRAHELTAFAWRITSGEDDGFLGALEPLDLLFEVVITSRGADAAHLYGLDTQHDPCPRSRGAAVATPMASSVRCSRSIS